MLWEGFLRALASDIWAGIGIVFVIAVFYGLISFFIKSTTDCLEDKKKDLSFIRTVTVSLILVVFLGIFGRAASVAFANRTPRQDIDKNPVYEQMDSHGQKDRR